MITIEGYWEFRIFLLVASILLAAVIWWGWRRLSRQGLRSNIQMDGAYCQVAENGDVLIRPHTIRDFIVLAWVGAGLACGMNLGFLVLQSLGGNSTPNHMEARTTGPERSTL